MVKKHSTKALTFRRYIFLKLRLQKCKIKFNEDKVAIK